MENISEYQLLSAKYSDLLSRRVNEYLQKGWELYGMPNAIMTRFSDRDATVFTQAVIKNE